MSIQHIVPPRYCIECGKAKKTMAFANDPYCSENCRKSIAEEGPKVGLSQEAIDRNIEAGEIIAGDEALKTLREILFDANEGFGG